jgi:hypothetical protein
MVRAAASIVRLRDLISAARYAFMMRRHGKLDAEVLARGIDFPLFP